MTGRPVLIVDDDEDCVKLLRMALERSGIGGNRFSVARDGEEALAYLKGEGAFADRIAYPIPALVLLDLKMPRVDGFQVLRWIRKESPFWYLPVVVLTVSSLDSDIWKAYAAGANSFMVKGGGVNELTMQLKSVIEHWIRFAVAPGPSDVPPPPPTPPS
jgi:CheY-like chemotaxis protein